MCHKRAREEADHLSYVALAFSKDMVSEPGGLERFGESSHNLPQYTATSSAKMRKSIPLATVTS